MPKIEVDLTEGALARLQLAVDDFNVQTGQSLTLEEWILLSLAQKAIEKELNVDGEVIKREHDAELPRRIDARRRELLKALGARDAVRVPPDGPA